MIEEKRKVFAHLILAYRKYSLIYSIWMNKKDSIEFGNWRNDKTKKLGRHSYFILFPHPSSIFSSSFSHRLRLFFIVSQFRSLENGAQTERAHESSGHCAAGHNKSGIEFDAGEPPEWNSSLFFFLRFQRRGRPSGKKRERLAVSA